jgi:Transcription factor WhiB
VGDEKSLSKNLLELLVPEWTKEAACQVVVDKELFFPIRGGSVKVARHICGQCSVRSECLMFSIEHYETFGIWGQTSDVERRDCASLGAITTPPLSKRRSCCASLPAEP